MRVGQQPPPDAFSEPADSVDSVTLGQLAPDTGHQAVGGEGVPVRVGVLGVLGVPAEVGVELAGGAPGAEGV